MKIFFQGFTKKCVINSLNLSPSPADVGNAIKMVKLLQSKTSPKNPSSHSFRLYLEMNNFMIQIVSPEQMPFSLCFNCDNLSLNASDGKR